MLGPLKAYRLLFRGLRKSAVVVCLIEAGCTSSKVAAITGQTLKMVEHYAEQVNQRIFARAAILNEERTRDSS